MKSSVLLGLKQGGISITGYSAVDEIGIVRRSGIGCHFVTAFVGCLRYADDLAVLAPSRSTPQRKIDLCQDSWSRIIVGNIAYNSTQPHDNDDGNNDKYFQLVLGITPPAGKSFLFTLDLTRRGLFFSEQRTL